MKKILTLLIGLMLLMPAALIGAPAPKPFVVYIKFDGEPVEGLNVDFTCSGMTVTQTTNNLGGVLVNAGEYGHFKDIGGCTILEVDCGYDSCRETFNVGSMDCPICEYTYELSEAPPEPEPECLIDSDCPSGYECINENCELIPESECVIDSDCSIGYECIDEDCIYIEPIVEDKVSSNTDGTIASVEFNFGKCIDVIITDTKLTKLFDGIINFDTEDYDTHEELRVKACSETSLDDADYGLEPYVLIEEGAIKYCYIFDDALPLTEIAEDEELEINFLGVDIEIIDLSGDRMTIRHGEIYLDIKEGESVDYEGLPLTVGVIDSDFVYVTYNGESEKIYEDEIGELGGIQVYVDESVPNEDGDDLCSLRIATDIEEVIDDGDEYNSDWDYFIQDNSICIGNSKEFKYLDEETNPLKLGDKIVLPNDFATIKFNEITTSETTEIGIKIREGIFNVLGDREDEQDDAFTFNNQDYDELYVGAEGILDEDQVLIGNRVRIGESEVYLEKGSIIIGDLVIEFDFLDILYKGISYALDDDSFLTYEGIIFKNPEKSVKDKSTFNVIVPDEVPELVITIGAEAETVGIEPEPEECVCDICTEEECVDIVCAKCTPCKVCEDCPEEKICPPVTTNLAAIIITGILSLAGGIGIFFKLFNNKIFTSSNTGIKSYRGRDGTLKILHKHPGTRGYHSPSTSHRAPETHPKGMIDVKDGYQKNSMGEWEYTG